MAESKQGPRMDRLAIKGIDGNFGDDENFLFLDCVSGYISACICQSSPNCAHKMFVFYFV